MIQVWRVPHGLLGRAGVVAYRRQVVHAAARARAAATTISGM